MVSFWSPVLLLLFAMGANHAYSQMTLQQFQSVLQTFVDDELSYISSSVQNAMDSDVENMLRDRVAATEFGNSRRTKLFHRKQQREHEQHDATDSKQAEDLWNSILDHGWEKALRAHSDNKFAEFSHRLFHDTSRDVRKRIRNGSNNKSSGPTTSLFLICHSSNDSLDGNYRLQAIMEFTNGGHNATGQFYENVYSSKEKLCIITVAEASAVIKSACNSIEIIPWVDMMKISRDILVYLTRDHHPRHDAASTVENVAGTRRNIIVFSVAPTVHGTVNARSILNEVIAADGDKRQRSLRGNNHNESIASLFDAFSMTSSASSRRERQRKNLNKSSTFWSRILSAGVDDCSSRIQFIDVSGLPSTYEVELTNETVDTSGSELPCFISIIVGLATHPFVTHVDLMAKNVEADNVIAQSVVQADLNSLRLPFIDSGLDGSGQIVSVSDTGLDIKNCFFKNTESGDNETIFSDWDFSQRKVVRYSVNPLGGDKEDTKLGHGTHVAGTIAGSHLHGLGLEKRGIASGSKIHFFDIENSNGTYTPGRHWFASFYDRDRYKGARIASASWGTSYLSTYDATCRLWDKLLVDHPDVLLVASAGNKGNNMETVGAPASCKNTLGVGAIFNDGYFPGRDYVASFSSRGPTADGRAAPDIMAPGYQINSAKCGFHNCYAEEPDFFKAGTSMATPVVSGAAAQVRQYFLEGWYPCGSPGCGNPLSPSGSLLKAVLANGARLLRGSRKQGSFEHFEQVEPYDNIQGMGALNLHSSITLLNETNFKIHVVNDESLRIGDVHSVEIEIDSDSCEDLRATLAWYDPPGASGCIKCIVNDLDLQIEHKATGEMAYPNGRFDADDKNTLERIIITKPAVGDSFLISLQASHFGPGYTEQKFSLVLTGCFHRVGKIHSPLAERLPPVMLESSLHMMTLNEVETTHDYNSHRYPGIMVSVRAKIEGIKIWSFKVQSPTEGLIRVDAYTKEGELRGPDLKNPSNWTKIADMDVEFRGINEVSTVEIQQTSVPKGITQSFFIFTQGAKLLCKKQRRKKRRTGAVIASDDNIEVLVGIGKNRFTGKNFRSCGMNGAIVYSRGIEEIRV